MTAYVLLARNTELQRRLALAQREIDCLREHALVQAGGDTYHGPYWSEYR